MCKDRYVIDKRAGCIAVLDTTLATPGDTFLDTETEGVEAVWNSSNKDEFVCPDCGRKFWRYVIPDEHVIAAHNLAAELNAKETP